MNLKKILGAETTTKSFRMSEDTTVVIKSLNGKEIDKVNREVFLKLPNCTDFGLTLMVSRIPTLCKAIVSVNGTPVQSLEDIQKYLKENDGATVEDAMRIMLEEFDDEYITTLFYFYSEVCKQNREDREKIKNFYQAQKVETSGS